MTKVTVRIVSNQQLDQLRLKAKSLKDVSKNKAWNSNVTGLIPLIRSEEMCKKSNEIYTKIIQYTIQKIIKHHPKEFLIFRDKFPATTS